MTQDVEPATMKQNNETDWNEAVEEFKHLVELVGDADLSTKAGRQTVEDAIREQIPETRERLANAYARELDRHEQ